MAGDWQMIRLDLHEDPAVIQITATCDGLVDEDHTVGKLARLWAWANAQTRDGNASGVTILWLDRYIGVTGFAEAMIFAGWLQANGDTITFPKFDRWMSDSAKTRAKTRKRVEKHRNAPTVTKALPEKRREEKRIRKKKDPPTPLTRKRTYDPTKTTIPAELQTAPFLEAWDLWCEDRRARGKKLTEAAVRLQMKKLVAMGSDRAVAAIKNTIEKQWTGIREPEPERQSDGRTLATSGRVRSGEPLEDRHFRPGEVGDADESRQDSAF